VKGVVFPRLWLLGFALAIALSCVPLELAIINGRRYADWANVSRQLPEVMFVQLAVIALLGMVMTRRALGDDLPWLMPHLPRAKATITRSALALGICACFGILLGWLPAFGWAFATATYGHPSVVGLLSVLMWVLADAVLAVAITAMSRSIWPAICLAVIWAVFFEYQRIAFSTGNSIETRLYFLPFDGIYVQLGGNDRQNPAMELIRLATGIGVVAVGIYALRRSLGDGPRAAKLKTGIVHWPALAMVAIFGGLATHSLSILIDSGQPLDCRNSVVRTCVFASHSSDLQTVETVVNRLHDRVGPLFAASVVSERPLTTSVTEYHIGISGSTTTNPASDVANQLAITILDPHGCYASTVSPNLLTIAEIVQEWLVSQARATPPNTGTMDHGRLTPRARTVGS
jgi:hypothetical protein